MSLITKKHLTHLRQLETESILIDKITNATVAAGMISPQKAETIELNKPELDLNSINDVLADSTAEEIVKWALSIPGKTIVTTNFAPKKQFCFIWLVKSHQKLM